MAQRNDEETERPSVATNGAEEDEEASGSSVASNAGEECQEVNGQEMSLIEMNPTPQKDGKGADDFFYITNVNKGSSGTEKMPAYVQRIQFSLDEYSEAKALPSKYLRVSSSISEAAIKRSILRLYDEQKPPDEKDSYAKVVLPELALTFIGGCEEQLLTEKLKTSLTDFTSGILRKLNCLLITRGSYLGVTKLIGKVCSAETVDWNYGQASKTIGVLPWPCVRGRDSLEEKEGSSVISYKPKMITSSTQKSTDWPLDPNQHFYFLIDDGITEKFGMESEYIMKLNSMLRKELNVPCVMVLIGGGKWSLEEMHKFLFSQQKDSTNESAVRNKPVVIVINGTGKLADLVSATVTYYNEKRKTDGSDSNPIHAEDEFLKDAIAHAKDEFKKNTQNDMQSQQLFDELFSDISKNRELKKQIKECLTEKLSQIFTVDFDVKENLETALYRALKVAEPSKELQLLFAIQSDDKSSVNSFLEDQEDHQEAAFNLMTDLILKSNKLQWIKMLLEMYEFNVEQYAKNHLSTLYNLGRLMHNRVAVSGANLDKLSSFFRTKKYRRKVKVVEGDTVTWDIDKVMNDLSDENTARKILQYDEGKINISIINPIQALLINSILFLDLNAAKLFWYFDQYNPLSNALLAYVLLSGLKKNAPKVYASAPYDFEKSLKHFESLICKLIDTYYKTSKEMTTKVVANKLELWKLKPVIHVAGEVGLKSLFGKQACKMFVMENWDKVPDEEPGSQDNESRKTTDDKSLPEKNDSTSTCCNQEITKISEWSCWQNLKTLKWKMRSHVAMHLLFMLLFATFVLFTNTVAHEPFKWIVMAFVLSLIVDEARQMKDTGKSWHRNIKNYLSSIWNYLDMLAIVSFFIGLSFSYSDTHVSKIMFSMYLVLSCLRTLQFLGTMPLLGVYMVMIGKMIGRMKMFMLVLSVSIISYGIFMTALLHPHLHLDWDILLRVLFRPSFAVFGDPGIESFELNNSTTVFGTSKVNVSSEILVIIGMAAFIFFANILLVNLLIADFSHIHGEVLERSEEILCFAQYEMQEELKRKPSFPIPFSIFQNVYSLLPETCKGNDKQKKTDDESLETSKIAEFERFCFRKLFPTIPGEVLHPGTRKNDEDTMTNLIRNLILMHSKELKLQ